MKRLLLTGLNQALQRYLQLDPEILTRIAPLSGKVIQVEMTQPTLTCYLMPHAQGITLSDQPSGEIDASIQGSAWQLFRANTADAANRAHATRNLNLTGDILLAQQLSQILQAVQIDWEETLSKGVGDTLAHQMGQTARRMKSWLQTTAHNLRQNTRDYIHYEAQVLPTGAELETFYQEIYQLQQDVDRIEATLACSAGENRENP
ncbi:MAG: SCP2 sterol-binding domain-containing protein [Gammaproteobacteria bacterium]